MGMKRTYCHACFALAVVVFMDRKVCPTVWIMGPEETKYVLRAVLRSGILLCVIATPPVLDITNGIIVRERSLLDRALAALPDEVLG